ncbi:hypothetical protein [Corynebacterium variabile]|uniref:hypothetical protein n=1 Tax=Corynebacterium variabile TaxID=1727 RepID=UPI003A9115C8
MPIHSQPVSVPDIYQSLNLDRTQSTSALYSQVTSGIQQLVAQGTPESDYTLQLARYAEQVLRDDASRSGYEQSLGGAPGPTGYTDLPSARVAAVSSGPTGDPVYLRLIAWILVGLSFGTWALCLIIALGKEDTWEFNIGYFASSAQALILIGIFGLSILFVSGNFGTPGSRPAVIVGAIVLFLHLARKAYVDLDYYFDYSGRYSSEGLAGLGSHSWSFMLTLITVLIIATQIALICTAVVSAKAPSSSTRQG